MRKEEREKIKTELKNDLSLLKDSYFMNNDEEIFKYFKSLEKTIEEL